MAQVPDDVVEEFQQALDDEADRWLREAASEIPSVKDEKT